MDQKFVWVCQKILADDPGAVAVEWDTFNVGLLEEGHFRTVYSCWSQEDADYLLASLRWYSEFQEQGIMSGIPKTARAKRVLPKREKKI